MYGDHSRLHLRLLQSLVKHLPSGAARVVVWANEICHQTAEWLQRQAPKDWEVVFSKENVPKYKAMRQMFHETHKPTTPWLIWFDDDSWVQQANWWPKTRKYIEEGSGDLCYIGQLWFVHHLPGQQEFMKAANWYTGVPWQQCPTRRRDVRKPGINFAQGAYWWLRTDVMRKIDWPDPRLNHNGGDSLLAEAVHQQGLPFNRFHYGVKINDAGRRGYHERPAGSTINVRR